jgi:hypothetical protein
MRSIGTKTMEKKTYVLQSARNIWKNVMIWKGWRKKNGKKKAPGKVAI